MYTFRRYLAKAQTLLRYQRYTEAIHYFQRALAIRSDNPIVFLGLGRSFAKIKQYRRAKRNIDRALQLDPRSRSAWWEKAILCEIDQRWDEAVYSWCRVIALAETRTALFRRGVCLYRLQVWKEAQADFQSVVQQDPTYSPARLYLGLISYHLSAYEEALSQFQPLLENQPENPFLWYNVASVWVKMGKREQAKVGFSNAIRRRPRYTKAWLNLGIIHWEEKNYPEALKMVQSANTLCPRQSQTLYYKGLILTALERYPEALATLDSIETPHAPAKVWAAKGDVYFSLDHHERAEECFAIATLLNPQNGWFWFRRGMVYVHLGNPDLALQFFRTANQMDSTIPIPRKWVADHVPTETGED